MGVAALGNKGIIGAFYQRLEVLTGQSWIGQIGMAFTSNQETETYKWLGMSPAMREWVGGRLAKGLRDSGLTITNKTWESTLQVDVDDKRRDKTGQLLVRINEQAMRAVEHWSELLSLFINAGEATTYGNSYDSTTFFSATHSNGSSGTWLNLLTSTQVTELNIATAANPTPEEMATAIFATIAYLMQNVKDDQGKLYNKSARNWLVMTSTPSIYAVTEKALSRRATLDTNGVIMENLIPGSAFNVSSVFNPELTALNGFHIFRTDAAVKPFILQEEQGITMSVLAEGSEQEFMNNFHLYGLKALRNVGYGMPECAAKCTFN